MSSIHVIFTKASESESESKSEPFELTPANIKSSSVQFQSLKFSVATRRLPLLVFWLFLGLAVIMAGCLAHNHHSWQTFWNQEAILNRNWALGFVPFGRFFDSFTTEINKIFIKSGWIFAAFILILVQAFYILLIILKRDHVPNLKFVRQFPLLRLVLIEAGVLLMGTIYFLICTWTFNRLAQIKGSCSFSDGTFSFPIGPDNCKSPAIFRGFDISGHCFLIVHSCLLVMEYAAKVLVVWKMKICSNRISNLFSDKDSDLENAQIFAIEDETFNNSRSSEEPQPNLFLTRNYSIFHFLLIILLISVLLICILELFIYLQTILFYHTVTEKIIGTLIGAGFWLGLFGLSLKYPYLF